MSDTLLAPDGNRIAYDRVAGRSPTVVFLHGLASDKSGTKAMALEVHCRARELTSFRFDMFGHGASSGRFEDGGPTRWTDSALAVIDRLTTGPVILVGSSMGGWIALKAAMARPSRVAGLIGIAAAPDFTETMIWPHFTADEKARIEAGGVCEIPSDGGGPPLRISPHLIEDGRRNLIMGGQLDILCPVRLLQGQRDASVPWPTAQAIAERLSGGDVIVTLIKDGDHRLSRPQDLDLLTRVVDDLASRCAPS